VVFDDTLGQGEKAQLLRAAVSPSIGGTPLYRPPRRRSLLRPGGTQGRGRQHHSLRRLRFIRTSLSISVKKESGPDTSSNPAAKAQTSSAACSSAKEEDGDDVFEMLEAYKKGLLRRDQNSSSSTPHQTASKSPSVLSLTGKKFVHSVNINSNTKNFFPGEVGPPTGEMGTAMFWSEPNLLFKPHASQDGVPSSPQRVTSGYVDLNCIVNKQRNLSFGIHLAIRLSHHQHSAGRHAYAHQRFFSWELATGVDAKWRTRSGFQIGIRIVVPPFSPFDGRCHVRILLQETTPSFSKSPTWKASTSRTYKEVTASGSSPAASWRRSRRRRLDVDAFHGWAF